MFDQKIDNLFNQKTNFDKLNLFIDQSKSFLLKSIGENYEKSKCNNSGL